MDESVKFLTEPHDKEFEFLMKYIEETNNEMRHLEEMRDKVSSILVAIIGAILSFITISKTELYCPLGLFIILLSVFGILFTQKIYQLHNKGQMRLNKWYCLLKLKYNIKDVFHYRNKGDLDQDRGWLKFLKNNILHNYLWTSLYMFILIIGFFLIIKN